MERVRPIIFDHQSPVVGMEGLNLLTAGLTLRGMYTLEIVRHGRTVDFLTACNDVTNAGLNHILETQFRAGSQVTTWYLGLINNAGGPVLANADTLASHSGWTEFTDYSGDRKAWTPDAASGGVMSNSTSVDFTMTGSGTIAGLFLASVSSGTGGTLWSTALFTGDATAAVIATDVLKLTYTINAVRS